MQLAISAVRKGVSKKVQHGGLMLCKSDANVIIIIINVPRTTLLDKLSGRTPVKRLIGRKPHLSQAEEQANVQ